MRKSYLLILCLLLAFVMTGCSGVKTYTYQTKRVDQDLGAGNRGVIMGEVPIEEPDRKPTRTMVGVDIELPLSEEYKARKQALKEEPIITLTVPPMPPGAPPIEPGEKERYVSQEITYTIQKGDTLQKIAKKFYGTTRKWPEIYEANKDVIKASSKVYPGQVIIIPPSTPAQPVAGDSTVQFGLGDYK